MKLKQAPDDFQVEEVTDFAPTGTGPFALYRLEKRGWTTPDALAAVRRRWKLEPQRLSYAGLKDRHAHTIQYLTIFHGPRRRLTHQAVALEYLGQADRPYTSPDIRGNRFRIVLRDLREAEAAAVERALAEVGRDGVPNYFDDQRFGSVGRDQEFIGRLMVQGRHEDALRQALVAPYEHDRAPQKREKAMLAAHWGDWAALKSRLPQGHAQMLVEYLRQQPGDFRGALERLRPELRGLYLSAYQSHLWNRMLAHWLQRHLRPDQLLSLHLQLGEIPVHRDLNETQRAELAGLRLPLPSPRSVPEPGDAGRVLVDQVLAEEGITLDQMKLKGFRKVFFSKGDRAALCVPAGLGHEAGDDERHPDRRQLTLAFDLPPGAYATLIVKRVTAVQQEASER